MDKKVFELLFLDRRYENMNFLKHLNNFKCDPPGPKRHLVKCEKLVV